MTLPGQPKPSTAPAEPGVAFVGLGAMGRPMVERLLDAGVGVSVCDSDRARAEGLVGMGASVHASAAEAAAGASVALIMVVDAAQIRDVLFGPDGVVRSLAPGGIAVVFSTIGSVDMRALAQEALPLGVRLVDAPVSGGVSRAETGDLLMMVGATQDDFERVRPYLALLASRIVHVSNVVGGGQDVKIVNQLICGVHIAAAGEALALAEAMGMDPAAVLETIGSGAASSFMLSDRGPRMVAPTDEVRSAIAIFVKDLALVLDAADNVGSPAPVSQAALGMFNRAAASGMAKADDSQIVAVYRSLRLATNSQAHQATTATSSIGAHHG